jgi:hypothetical protein
VHWTMLGVYRRETCYVIGPFCEDLASGEDKEYNLRVLLSSARVVYLPGVLFASRNHSGPRITDAWAENRLIFAVRRLQRTTESAATGGRLNNPRLVRALMKELSGVIVDALKADRSDLAREAIEICRKMPITSGLRVRLTIYQILTKCALGRLWMRLQKGRRFVLKIPKRIRRAFE